jgi:protocatechuate 3,4-dioxygenase beta subunit
MTALILVVLFAVGAERAERVEGQQPRDLAATPTSAASLSGIVVDERDQPVPRALITVTGFFDGGARTAMTQADGRFVLANLPAVEVRIMASRTGYPHVEHGQSIHGSPGTPVKLENGRMLEVKIVMPRGGVVSGLVRDVNGEPLPSAYVQVWARDAPGNGMEPRHAGSATTDHLGQYRVWGLAPGDYLVDLGESNRSPVLRLMAGEEREGIDIHALPPLPRSRVDGVALDAAGQPVRGLRVELFDAAMGSRVYLSSPLVQPDGRFTWLAVPAGHYRVFVSATVYEERAFAKGFGDAGGFRERASTGYWASTSIAPDGGAPVQIALTLQPSMTVAGYIVSDAGQGPPDLSRVFISLAPSELPPSALTSAAMSRTLPDGRFTIQHVPPGRYRLRAGAQGDVMKGWLFGLARLGDVDIFENEFEVKPGSNVEGIVVTMTNRTASPGR